MMQRNERQRELGHRGKTHWNLFEIAPNDVFDIQQSRVMSVARSLKL